MCPLLDLWKSFQSGTVRALELVQILTKDNERFRSVVNGVIGDTLQEQDSSLVIPMQLSGDLQGDKLCILVHGLFDTASTWRFRGRIPRDYGSLLQKDLGYSPLYLSYNTGLHISINGRAFSKLLIRACKENPKIKEIIFIGHSMGGLVIRSACHYGRKQGAPWIKHVRKVFFLGTPHLGSDWEKLGHLVSVALETIPNLWTLGIAAVGNKRSAGIKDLRFGYLTDEDWKGLKNKALWHDNRHAVPLLPQVDYYNIASLLAKVTRNLFSEYFGDGLVPMRSAAGKSFLKSRTLPFLPQHFRAFMGLSHTRTTRDHRVYKQILKWCGDSAGLLKGEHS